MTRLDLTRNSILGLQPPRRLEVAVGAATLWQLQPAPAPICAISNVGAQCVVGSADKPSRADPRVEMCQYFTVWNPFLDLRIYNGAYDNCSVSAELYPHLLLIVLIIMITASVSDGHNRRK